MRKILIGVFLFLFCSHSAFSQNSDKAEDIQRLQLLAKRLEREVAQKSDSLAVINERLTYLEGRQALISAYGKNDAIAIPATVRANGAIRTNYNATAKEVAIALKGESLLLTDFIEGYWLVKKGEQVGYINELFIESTADIDAFKNMLSNGVTEGQGSNLKSTSGNRNTSVKSSTGSRSSTGRVIHTGPRGGKYYINSNGNKTYIKRK